MNAPHDVIIRKLTEHSQLEAGDEAALARLPMRLRDLAPDDDLASEDDRGDTLAVIVEGLAARYHSLSNGKRQYLSFHLAGEMPDAQMLFLEKRDYAICAIGKVRVALIERDDVRVLVKERPAVAFAIWRGTLIDAAIIRAAIGKQFSAQPAQTRMAHLFCDLYYRARSAGLAVQGSYRLPLHQGQLADALAMSLVTVNRTLQKVRKTGALHFRQGLMTVHDWPRLAAIGRFDPSYLHIRRVVRP